MQTTDALNDDAIDFTNELFGDYDLDMYIIDEGNVHNILFSVFWPELKSVLD